MQNTISDNSYSAIDIPYSVFNPVSEDFAVWENSLTQLLAIYPGMSASSKITVLLKHLPSQLRQEAVQFSEKPISYDNMVLLLKTNYAKTVSLKKFYSCEQSKIE